MNVVEHGICEFLCHRRAIGLGSAIDPMHVVTCAHVVDTAHGHGKLDPARPGPGDVIRVQFPIGSGPDIDTRRTGLVIGVGDRVVASVGEDVRGRRYRRA